MGRPTAAAVLPAPACRAHLPLAELSAIRAALPGCAAKTKGPEGPFLIAFPDDRHAGRWQRQWLRIFARSRAIDWLCSWQMRDSVTPSTAAISFRFMSCS